MQKRLAIVRTATARGDALRREEPQGKRKKAIIRHVGGIVQAPLAQLPWYHQEKIMFGLFADGIT